MHKEIMIFGEKLELEVALIIRGVASYFPFFLVAFLSCKVYSLKV